MNAQRKDGRVSKADVCHHIITTVIILIIKRLIVIILMYIINKPVACS